MKHKSIIFEVRRADQNEVHLSNQIVASVKLLILPLYSSTSHYEWRTRVTSFQRVCWLPSPPLGRRWRQRAFKLIHNIFLSHVVVSCTSFVLQQNLRRITSFHMHIHRAYRRGPREFHTLSGSGPSSRRKQRRPISVKMMSTQAVSQASSQILRLH